MITTRSSRITASAFPVAPPPRPVMSFAEYAAMENDCANIDGSARLTLSNADIVKVIAANPGITRAALGAKLKRNADTTLARVKALIASGHVKSEIIQSGNGRRYPGYFAASAKTPIPEPSPTRKFKDATPRPPEPENPLRDATIAYIRANPGCTTRDLAAEFGCSVKTAASRVTRARAVVTIRSEREGSNSNPAQLWVVS